MIRSEKCKDKDFYRVIFILSREDDEGSFVKSITHCITKIISRFFSGFTDLTNKQVVTSLLSVYAQVVVWFCRSSLLPEGLGKHQL